LFVAQYQTPGESAAGNEYFLKRGAMAFGRNPDTGKASVDALRHLVSKRAGITQNSNGHQEDQPLQLSLI
jgi:hypothetical protein